MRIHRVVVAHGALNDAENVLGGSGSLMIVPGIVGDEHQLPREKGGQPFAIGRVSATKPFVHVLDDTSLDLLLKNLDTVWDFVGYLRKKEAFISSGRLGDGGSRRRRPCSDGMSGRLTSTTSTILLCQPMRVISHWR